jgi:DedD protein
MGRQNIRLRERFELSLGGFQIASIIVGAVVSLAVVFLLGFEAGQRVGSRRAETARPASLGDLDAAATPASPSSGKGLTFQAELPKAKPTPPPPPRTPPPTDSPPPPSPPPPSPPPAAAEPPPAAVPATGSASRGGWTVQLGASQRREEAEALVRKVQALGPRIEEADIPGKGHFFRVRVGRFESRAEAEKYRSDVVRETGISGAVIPPAG